MNTPRSRQGERLARARSEFLAAQAIGCTIPELRARKQHMRTDATIARIDTRSAARADRLGAAQTDPSDRWMMRD
jgi:PIN domain nuclease of toxin-antitoxin system